MISPLLISRLDWSWCTTLLQTTQPLPVGDLWWLQPPMCSLAGHLPGLGSDIGSWSHFAVSPCSHGLGSVSFSDGILFSWMQMSPGRSHACLTPDGTNLGFPTALLCTSGETLTVTFKKPSVVNYYLSLPDGSPGPMDWLSQPLPVASAWILSLFVPPLFACSEGSWSPDMTTQMLRIAMIIQNNMTVSALQSFNLV